MTRTKARPHFDKDLKFGQQYENELQQMIEGKVEVKTDRLCEKTGNVFVEIESRGKPSGINVTEATYQAYCLVKDKRKKDIYLHRMLGFLNAIIGKSSYFRPKIKD